MEPIVCLRLLERVCLPLEPPPRPGSPAWAVEGLGLDGGVLRDRSGGLRSVVELLGPRPDSEFEREPC